MNKLYELSVNNVREACHMYWIDKNAGYFLEHCTVDDGPVIGVCDPAWEAVYGITSEHYQGYVQSENLCLVSARIALIDKTDENTKEILTNITVLCRLKEDTIQFLSIHISRSDGKEIAPNRAVLSDSYYRRTLEFMFDVVLEYQTANNVFIYDKDKYQELFQVDTHFINMDQWFWHMCTECVLPEDTEKLDVFRRADIEKRLRNNGNFINTSVRIKNREKGLLWIQVTIIIIPNDKNTAVERVLILMKNIDDEMQERMQNLTHARMDDLTKVWNRYYTEQLINEYLETFSKGIYILFDVDRFKNVNDSYGHITGDVILKRIASSISSNITINDIFGRIGGDEFVLFLTEYNNSEKEIMDKISNILKNIQFDYSEQDIHMAIHCSAGVAVADEQTNSFQMLYKMADKALYEAKKSGRNTFRIS